MLPAGNWLIAEKCLDLALLLKFHLIPSAVPYLRTHSFAATGTLITVDSERPVANYRASVRCRT